MKKYLAPLLALSLLCCLCLALSLTAFAETVATVTVGVTATPYESITDAWAAAQSGTQATPATLRLSANVNTSDTLTVGESTHMTLDLNGYVLNYAGTEKRSVITNNGNLSVIDSNEGGKSHKFVTSGECWKWDDSTGDRTVSGGAITGGTGNETLDYVQGGGICNCGTLTLTGVNIAGCSAFTSSYVSTYGGGIYNDYGCSLTMADCSILGCEAFSSNETDGDSYGGGIYLYEESTAAITNCTFEDCISHSADEDAYGGALRCNYSEAVLTNCVIKNCKSISDDDEDSYGGGIANSGSLTLNGCVIENCLAYACDEQSYGGGIRNSGTLVLNNTAVRNCRAVSENSYVKGGGISSDGSLTLTGSSSVTGCSVSCADNADDISKSRGGVYIYGYSMISLSGNVVITGNTDGFGNPSNLFLEFFEEEEQIYRALINLTNPGSGMKIGVSSVEIPTADAPIPLSDGEPVSYSQYFTSDDSLYYVAYNKTLGCLTLATEPEIRPAEKEVRDVIDGSEVNFGTGSSDQPAKENVGTGSGVAPLLALAALALPLPFCKRK